LPAALAETQRTEKRAGPSGGTHQTYRPALSRFVSGISIRDGTTVSLGWPACVVLPLRNTARGDEKRHSKSTPTPAISRCPSRSMPGRRESAVAVRRW